MISHKFFIGIDIGKYNFVVALYSKHITTKEYENSPGGINNFIKEFKAKLSSSLCVLENTGGHETRLLLTLCDRGIAVHRADTRKVKYFIRSYGNGAKTDTLDAKALALYGFERHKGLPLFIPQSKNLLALYELVMRRQDLNQILVAEKNRLQTPRAASFITQSCTVVIKSISAQLCFINAEIETLIEHDEVLREKKKVLKGISGIGDIIASSLIVLMPELGSMSRRQAASLAGVAPKACDSGTINKYRRTAHGRGPIKPLLFMAAMAARNSHSLLRDFYDKLIKRGKKKMVALTALMRKIIVIANARLKPFYEQPPESLNNELEQKSDQTLQTNDMLLVATLSFDALPLGMPSLDRASLDKPPQTYHSS